MPTTKAYFITHPDVNIDKSIPTAQWDLSNRGKKRVKKLLAKPWVNSIGAVFCSTEQKAITGAKLIADHLGLKIQQIEDLEEMDRTSTGYLEEPEFQQVVDEFFAKPEESVRGWEKAIDAQRRIVAAVEKAISLSSPDKDIAIVSHGGVGALLLCHLKNILISRSQDQPGRTGGNYFVFETQSRQLIQNWRPID